MQQKAVEKTLYDLESGDEVAFFDGYSSSFRLRSEPATIERTTKLYIFLKNKSLKFKKSDGDATNGLGARIKPVTFSIKNQWNRQHLIAEFTALLERQNFPFLAVRQAIQKMLEQELTEGECNSIVSVLLKSDSISNTALEEAMDILWKGVDC